MTNSVPDNGTGNRSTPTTSPGELSDDRSFRHSGDWNSLQFAPPLKHEDALVLAERAEELGYRMLFRRDDYSLEEIQARLINEGPSAFLDLTWLQEDISPTEPPAAAEQRMAERMRALAPTSDLVVTDPYLFTRSRVKDSRAYALSLGTMMAPALVTGLQITAIVKPSENDPTVRSAVEAELRAREPTLKLSVVESDDFHDRFWVADRERGLVIGASLNKIGRRIFFVDELSDTDVAAVLSEVDQVLADSV